MLDNDWSLAMSEGDRFLQGAGSVHETLARLTKRLDELQIPYALAGGMALYAHGFRRVTEDIDLIVTKDDLRLIHQRLDGLGYLRPFEASKNLRDVHSKVKIEFLIAGEFPGDGKPKPVAFPDPRLAFELRGGIQVLPLPRLIELKLASGMTGAGRMKDLGDVEQLISMRAIPRDLANQLHDYVRARYLEIWDSLHQSARRYVLVCRNPTTENLAAMVADGVAIDPSRSTNECAYLVTANREVAEKYDMQPEDEILFDDSAET